MGYVSQNFYPGQKLRASNMKLIEAGIQTADANAEQALKIAQDLILAIPEALASKADNWMIDEETGLLYLTSNGEKISSGISLSGGTGEGGGGTPYAVQYVFQKLTEKQKAQARENIGAVSAGQIDLKFYGITAADYEAPFTAEMYEVAYANGRGFQKAIDDAKAAGRKEIVIPNGNYPLCWSGGDDERNPVIVSESVDIYGNDSRLYVIFDEDGINPYFTGTNPHTLSGSVIVTDSSVYDLNIEGERQYRVTSPGWKDKSKGIGLTGNCHNNVIQNCAIKHISGDGIGCHQLGIQLATWTDTFTSFEWNGSAYVASKKMYRSGKHGVSFIHDMSAPYFINSTPNFMWSTEPFIIRCFDGESEDDLGNMIGAIRVHGMQYFYFPEGTKTWFVELTREAEHAEDATETYMYFLRQGYYSGTQIIGCELCYNQRGGMSNLPDSAVIRNCRVHDNGNPVNGMVAYYDSTRFGLDQEEVVVGSLTIEDSLFYGSNTGVFYKSWSIMLKNSKFYGNFSGVCSLNGAVDFTAINCDFVANHSSYGGACILIGSAEFGEKTMIGCRVVGRISDDIVVFGGDMSKAIPVTVLGTDNFAASANYVWFDSDSLVEIDERIDALEDFVNDIPQSLNTKGLIKHVDFTSSDPMVDKVTGEVYTTVYRGAQIENAIAFDENGAYATQDCNIKCTDFSLSAEYTAEIVCHNTFGTHIFTDKNNSTQLYNPSSRWSKYPKSLGGIINPPFTQYEKDGVFSTLYDGALLEKIGDTQTVHMVLRCDGTSISCKMNGYDLATADGAKSVPAQALDVSYIACTLVPNVEGRLKEIRYYDRAMTDKEVAQAYRYQKQKDAGIINAGDSSASGGGIDVTGASVGQIVQIAAVDENGVPTKWQPVDMPSGGGGGGGSAWMKIREYTVPEDVKEIDITTDENGNTFAYDHIICEGVFVGTSSNTTEKGVNGNFFVDGTKRNFSLLSKYCARISGTCCGRFELITPHGTAGLALGKAWTDNNTTETLNVKACSGSQNRCTGVNLWGEGGNYIGAGTVLCVYGMNY